MNANTKLLSVMTVLGLVTIGCSVKSTDDPEPLGSNESQLVADDDEASEADEDVEIGVEEPLSGATPADPGSPADGATDAELMGKVKTNPGLFFQPAGCLTTTIQGNVATHVFAGCTGPYGMTKFDGTVTVTYVREAGKLTITYEASGFKVNGATVSGKRVVVYTRSGTTITKERTGAWTGTTAKGNPISHDASFVTTWDAATKCITRDGSAKTSIGGRSFERSIENYERCGIGRLGCPESGKVVLTRTKSGESMSLTIDFLGGRDVRITRPNGTQVVRQLLCRAS